MKLIIINGENNNEKLEININECSLVQDAKCIIDEILHGNLDFTSYCYMLIYDSIILAEHNSIKYYKICENNEIWFGKVFKYLREDDVIVYVFYYLTDIYSYDYLIVKMNDTIAKITSIIERVHSEINNIWNADGKEMKNDQIVTEIDEFEDYILFISCKTEIIKFQDCRDLHNKRWIDRFLYVDQIRDDNKNESIRLNLMNLINQIRQIITSNDTIDERLNQKLSDFPSSYLNSGFFFRGDMAVQIYYICRDGYMFLKNSCQYRDDVMKIFATYSFFAIRAALVDYFNSRKDLKKEKNNNSYSIEMFKNESNKSKRCIVIVALDYFMKYLNDPRNDWQHWLRLWTSQYILGSFSDDDVNKRIEESNLQKFRIKLKTSGNDSQRFTARNPKTVIVAKKTISDLLKVNMKHLYCIKPGGDCRPNDEDAFDDEFIIEIVMSMDDIEILNHLAQGGYGEVYLCRDKISGNQFVLKKQLGSQSDLYRDISIQCQMINCGNIMKYQGLYNIDDNICFTIQYMPQGSIRSYLNEGKRFSENDLIKICYQILLQIREIHRVGIIHRDIKCDNIVLDEHNNAKLIDFGLSKFTEDLCEEDLLKNLKAYKPGAVRFMAPEILKCEKYTKKIDIWSFGAAMIEMITGKVPYSYMSDSQAMLRIRNSCKIEFERPESISQQFIELIDLCLNRDPDERPSAEQLIQMEIFNKKFENINK